MPTHTFIQMPIFGSRKASQRLMKFAICHGNSPDSGFTIIELTIVVIIAGILASLSFVTYREWADRELLKTSAQLLMAWLDERRTQGMASMASGNAGACIIKINAPLAQLSAASTKESVYTGNNSMDVFNLCQSSDVFNLRQTSNRSSKLNISATGDNPSQLLFTFRGTSPINSPLENAPSYLEFKITKPGHTSATCLKVIKPLGLMRLGMANSTVADCEYYKFYSDSRKP